MRINIEVGRYTLTFDTANKFYTLAALEDGGWCWWLANNEGEGMSMSNHDVEEMLDKYFKEHF